MSFNPVMALLTQAALARVRDAPSVLEFGNQTFTVDPDTLNRVITRASNAGRDVAALRAINALDMAARRDRTAAYYTALGARSYAAIDVNDTYGSLVMDLNKDLEAEYQFHERFDLVTNNGTGEHVFDQMAVYRNAHKLTRTGGLMVHVMPFVNYLNHGFYSFHPNLYHALAVANDYAVLGLGIATRGGAGVIAMPPGSGDEPLTDFLLGGQRVEMHTLLSEPKVPRRNAPRGWLERLVARLPGATDQQRFGLYIHRLLLRGRKILVFAILRKCGDANFVVPIQLRYTDVVSQADLDRNRARGVAATGANAT